MPNAPVTPSPTTPDGRRRARVVWAALVASMTGVGGLLLALDGRPTPRLDGLALIAPVPAAGAATLDAVFNTRRPLDRGRWQGIVIHHSGALHGSASSLAAEHASQRVAGLGYHFVIGNGDGAENGELHVGYRWLDQLPGAHVGGPDQTRFNERYIGICLIGDGDRRPFSDAQLRRLTRLVAALASELELPPESIVLHRDVAASASPGRLFPEAAFRRGLAETVARR